MLTPDAQKKEIKMQQRIWRPHWWVMVTQVIASLENLSFTGDEFFEKGFTSSSSSVRNAVNALRATMKKGERMQKIIQISSILI